MLSVGHLDLFSVAEVEALGAGMKPVGGTWDAMGRQPASEPGGRALTHGSTGGLPWSASGRACDRGGPPEGQGLRSYPLLRASSG